VGDEEEEKEEENVSDHDKEMPPAVKIGPPKVGKEYPLILKILSRLQDHPLSLMISCCLPLLQSLDLLSQVSPKKKTSKKTQPNEITRPATCSSLNPSLTKIKVKINEAPELSQNDQGKKSSRRHGETELVDKVNKLF
jgi:hypothetical protein